MTALDTALIALIPLVGVISGVLAGWLSSSRSLYVNSITIERNKWIDKLRSNIAAYTTEAQYMALNVGMDDRARTRWESSQDVAEDLAYDTEPAPYQSAIARSELMDHYKRLRELGNTIELQLNPDGVIDKNIIRLLNSGATGKLSNNAKIGRLTRLINLHAQWLLKAEWEKVKFEGGDWRYRRHHGGDEQAHISRYIAWEAEKASVDIFIRSLSMDTKDQSKSN